MVDIDHGNDLVTRYAHLSKLFVKEGDVVQRGRKIGEVGLHRPLDRPAPAFRGALPRRGAEPGEVPFRDSIRSAPAGARQVAVGFPGKITVFAGRPAGHVASFLR